MMNQSIGSAPIGPMVFIWTTCTFGWKARVESVCYHLEQTLTVNQMVYVMQGCITEHFNMSAISKNISFKAYLSGEHREYGVINLYSPCQVALSSDRRNGYPNVN